MDQDAYNLREILEYYRTNRHRGGQELLVELLREIQGIYGYIPPQAKEGAAEAMGISPAAISALIRRIPSLREQPFQHEITVCIGPRCTGKGARTLLAALEKRLGVSAGEVSADGKIALTTQNCFKKCGSAPNIRIDGIVIQNVNENMLEDLLNRL